MMDRRAFIAGGLAAAALAPQEAAAQAGWTLLGTRLLTWGMTRESITVTRSRHPVTALSFRTRGGEVLITEVEVFFVRGAPERLRANVRARPQSRSSSILLRNRDRVVNRVSFTYRKPPRRLSTTVELYGRRA